MSLIEYEYPPILTPRAIRHLDGQLGDPQREALLGTVHQAIVRIFRPVLRLRAVAFRRKVVEATKDFVAYRLLLNAQLLAVLGPRGLEKILSFVEAQGGPSSRKEWKKLGIEASKVDRIIGRYAKVVRELIRSLPAMNCWPESQALYRLRDGFLWVATELDFGLTALFLAREGELEASGAQMRWLLGYSAKAVRRFDDHVRVLCRRPENLEQYFLQLLSEHRLWTPPQAEDLESESAKFRPITIRGEPLSKSVLSDRG